VKENIPIQNEAYNAGVHHRLAVRLNDKSADVRAAACFALGSLVGGSRAASLQDISSFQAQKAPFSSFQTPAGLVHQHMATAANVIVPDSVPASVAGQFTFAPAGAALPNLHAMQSMPVPQGQQIPAQLGAQFWSQPIPPAQSGQPLQAPHMMQGQPLTSQHNVRSPTSFLVGGSGHVVGSGQQTSLMSPSQLHQQLSLGIRPSMKPSVFDDWNRLEFDLFAVEALLRATDDGSVIVRYEATVALGCAVGKYFDAFVLVAGGLSAANSPNVTDRESKASAPKGLEQKYLDRFRDSWKMLRSLQREDPYPAISKAANEIVSVVHEHLLRYKIKGGKLEEATEDDGLETAGRNRASVLAGIDEELVATGSGPGSPSSPTSPSAETSLIDSISERHKQRKQADMRRVASEVVTRKVGAASMEESALRGVSAIGQATETIPSSYTLPKSEYYEWKNNTFDPSFEFTDEGERIDPDPLSPTGAARAYRKRRNFQVRESAKKLELRYASLAPKPPKPSRKSIEYILEEEEDETALLAAEEEASTKKRELELKEKRLFRNEGVNMTSLVTFHPYEDFLIACGGTDAVSVWDTNSGNRIRTFENGNPKGSRMTSSLWINEESSSLFLVGCDDGTVKIWGDVLPLCQGQPTLVSAFNAAPMEADHWGSGLVCEWQQYSGTLLAGGHSKHIYCWDLEAEKVVNKLETDSNAYVTTLTTAWDYDSLGLGLAPQGNQGIGRDTVVAGHSDGSLKIFDIRTKRAGGELREPVRRRQRQRATSYSEHKSWVVTTAFRGYLGRYELISGTVSGEIKAWDLRLPTSIRTVEAQRSTITALAVHSKIPLLATGSSAQYIKVLTLDGDTMQVLRYHEKMANHRMGPVSCLAFHPYKSLLAAGATDTFIGLYTTKQEAQQKR
jgi:regulator-associated protein of mTOR